MSGVANTIQIHLRTASLILLLLLFHAGYSQEGFIVSGHVTDRASGEPLENVNVSLKSTSEGASTNKFGDFTLRVKQIPFELEFSHIAYEVKTVRYEHEPLMDLEVELTPRTEPLSEVTITSQRIDTLYADRIYSVLDYELCKRGILLLIYKSRLSQAELLLQDYEGNKLLKLAILPMKPLGLYRDCLGEVHILSKDKAYQVAIGDDRIQLYDPYDLDYFSDVMSGCRFMIGSKVYFEALEYFELVKKIYYVNTQDTISHLLATTADQDKIDFLRQNPENYISEMRDAQLDILSRLNGTESDFAAIGTLRNLDTERRFNKMAYLSRIYAPIFPMRDTIVFFNHPMDVIQVYDTNDVLVKETPIHYHLPNKGDTLSGAMFGVVTKNRWTEEVYVDEIGNKAYTTFRKMNGTLDLEEIDLDAGALTFKLNIPFAYVQKIHVRDGYLYFIYKGFGDTQRKKLFRQQIY